MSNQELIELLTQKAQHKQLAAFYIVENHPHLPAQKTLPMDDPATQPPAATRLPTHG